MKTDQKYPVIMEEKKSGVTGRVVSLLAGGVIFLSVAFIVLIACGTFLINQKNDCDVTNTEVVQQHSEPTEVEECHEKRNTSVIRERTISYPESQREYSVLRDDKTGHVMSIIILDYGKALSAYYEAKANKCYLYDGIEGTFNDNKDHVVMYETGSQVMDQSEVPLELTPFCTTSNSFWLIKDGAGDEAPGFDKRSSSDWGCCCAYRCRKHGDHYHCSYLCDWLPMTACEIDDRYYCIEGPSCVWNDYYYPSYCDWYYY